MCFSFGHSEVTVAVVALHRSRTQPQLTTISHADHAYSGHTHSGHTHSSTPQHMDTLSTPTNQSCTSAVEVVTLFESFVIK